MFLADHPQKKGTYANQYLIAEKQTHYLEEKIILFQSVPLTVPFWQIISKCRWYDPDGHLIYQILRPWYFCKLLW